MEFDNTITFTYRGNQTRINGLPHQILRHWDNNNIIKFYHRGRNSWPTFTKTGKFKAPRDETQIYLNGKYFLQVNHSMSQEGEETTLKLIKVLYCCGCEWKEIKRILKHCFYQSYRG